MDNENGLTPVADDVVWTPREAFACALCWSSNVSRDDTPEQYWLRLDKKDRNEYRHIANNRLLLAVARNEAVAVLPPAAWSDDQLGSLGEFAGLTSKHRVYQIVSAVWNAARRRLDCDSDD